MCRVSRCHSYLGTVLFDKPIDVCRVGGLSKDLTFGGLIRERVLTEQSFCGNKLIAYKLRSARAARNNTFGGVVI